jgi:toxin-antitoxin system PIN domain toxin
LIIPDINLLLYAHITSFPKHAAARAWWETVINGQREIGLVAPVVFGFIRIGTNPRVFAPPMSVEIAVGHVESWLSRPHVRFLMPGRRHLEVAFGLLRTLGAAASLTTDAQIAAFAIENQAELCSNDTDFARFAGLRWDNPLS